MLPGTPCWAQRFENPTLNGYAELTVKAGSTAGQQLRLAKRGLHGPDGVAGALYAVIVIKVPSQVSDAERALYQQLAEAFKFQARAHFG